MLSWDTEIVGDVTEIHQCREYPNILIKRHCSFKHAYIDENWNYAEQLEQLNIVSQEQLIPCHVYWSILIDNIQLTTRLTLENAKNRVMQYCKTLN